MKNTEEYYQALEVCNNAKDYHNMDVMVARTYVRAYDEAINYSRSVSQHRELLIAVFERLDRTTITMIEIGDYDKAVDEILSY